jgi:deoxyribonuclease V|tara:strand:+ start:1910 stop:2602 length:693 start_codon:yes stop_codon:yes gene_type:complete
MSLVPLKKYQQTLATSEAEAIKLQHELALLIECENRFGDISLIAGVDVAYIKNSDDLIAAVVVLDASTLEVVEQVVVEDKATFPYIPGLFSFRELPSLLKAFAKLENTPDLVVCDGQGIAHPRRFGLACHLGLVLDVPAIGCGKSRLLGEFEEVADERGARSLLVDKGDVIGHVLKTQRNIKPVYISVGHRIDIDTASEWVLKLSPKYRLPETTRLSDQLVKRYAKEHTA